MLHVVVIGNSPGFELVIVVSPMTVVPPVNVMTAPVPDVLPTKVTGNRKLSGLIVISAGTSCTPAPDIATETLPALAVSIVI